MMNLPKENRRGMIVGGVNTFDDLELVLAERDMPPAPPKTYIVEVPGGNGEIDLTESFFGDVAYGNREMAFTFEFIGANKDLESVRDNLIQLLHGKRKEFAFTFDEGYTYAGRFNVESTQTNGRIQRFVVKVNADPFKWKPIKTEFFNVSDGIEAKFDSGRKRVQPTFEFSADTIVVHNGNRYIIPAGTHTLNDVWFTQGMNEVTFVLAGTESHIAHSEMAQYTHEQLAKKKNWELYKGQEKYFVDEIVLEGVDAITTGEVTFTATDSEGNTIKQVLDLGEITVTKSGTVCDTVRIEDGFAIVQQYISVTNGAKTVLDVPNYFTIDCAPIFSNAGEIETLTHDSAATVTFTTGSINTEIVYRRALHADYMEDGNASMTNAQMKAFTHGQLMLIEDGSQEVSKDRNEQVFVQYDWYDL